MGKAEIEARTKAFALAVGLSTQERAIYDVDGVGHVSIAEISLDEQPLRSSGDGLPLSLREPDIEPLGLAHAVDDARAVRT